MKKKKKDKPAPIILHPPNKIPNIRTSSSRTACGTERAGMVPPFRVTRQPLALYPTPEKRSTPLRPRQKSCLLGLGWVGV